MKYLKYFFILLLLSLSAIGATINLAWDQNSETDIAGYRLYRSMNGASFANLGSTIYPATTAIVTVDYGTNVFYVTAYNSAGLESPPPSITVSYVLPKPVNLPLITNGPISQTIPLGNSVWLYVLPYDTTWQYQWYKDGSPVSNGVSYYLAFSATSTLQSGSYFVKVSNGVGTISSPTANVVVLPHAPPTINVTGYSVGGISGTIWQNVHVSFGQETNYASFGALTYIVSATPTNGLPIILVTTNSPVIFAGLAVKDYVFSVTSTNLVGQSAAGATAFLNSTPPNPLTNLVVK